MPPARPPFSTLKLVGLTLVAVAAGWELQYLLGLPPGRLTGLLLTLPVAAAACSRSRIAFRVTLAVAGLLLATDAAVHWQTSGADLVLIELPLLSLAVLTCLGALLRRRLRRFDLLPPRYPERLTDRDGEILSQLHAASGQATLSDEQIELAMLVFSIEDIGRRMSGHVDRDSVLRTVADVCHHLLGAASVRIALFDESGRTLSVRYDSDVRAGRTTTPGGDCARRPLLADDPLCAWLATHRRVMTGEALGRLARELRLSASEPLPAAIAPLTLGGELLGFLVFDDLRPESDQQTRLIYILANLASLALKNSLLFEQLRQSARRDGLTGLLNHAAFQEELAAALKIQPPRDSAVLPEPVALVLGDIDHFKTFNDTHGHQVGDEVLRGVAEVWQRVLPTDAITARYGGEEFVAILIGETLRSASEIAESLRTAIRETLFETPAGTLRVTSSFGVAGSELEAWTPEDLIRTADTALYAAKHRGRDVVAVATELVSERRSGEDRRTSEDTPTTVDHEDETHR